MALTDFAPAGHPVRFSLSGSFHAVVRWIAARRAKRAQRVALQSLLFAPEHRLRDLGISHEQLIRAIENREW
jgi:uncharacterized protein YjiS (DUF1127 family)